MPPAASYASSTWSLRYTSPANRRRTTAFTASVPSVAVSAVSAVPAFPAASASVGFSIMIVVPSLSPDSEADPPVSFPVESSPSAPASPSVPVASSETGRLSPILPTSDGTRFPLSGRSVITPSATRIPIRRTLHSPTQRFVPRGACCTSAEASLRCSVLTICWFSDFRRLFPRSLQLSST